MISGARCCISGACAPCTSKVSTPPDLRPAGKADRFRRGNLGVALADDFAPAADHRALDEAEPLERHSADFTDQVAGTARAAAARSVAGISFGRGLRHRLRPCHRRSVPANAANRLIAHYVDNFRELPWRAPPGEPPPDPYRVWLSEVMLQQTTVAAVIPRFERFVDALADASKRSPPRRDEDILSEWAGLGYYARARNLIACARAVVGRRRLSVHRARASQLAGNRRLYRGRDRRDRVRPDAPRSSTPMSRAWSPGSMRLEQPAKQQIARLVAAMTPAGRPGDFAQAMMDLGATICRPAGAALRACPLSRIARLLPAGRPKPSRRRRRSARGRSATGSPIGSSATAPSGWFGARQGAARRDGGAARKRMDATSRAATRAARSAASATSSPISRSNSRRPARRARRRGLVASARPPRRGRASTLYRRAAELALARPNDDERPDRRLKKARLPSKGHRTP